MMVLLVISGSAVNTYFEEEANSNSISNEGSSINSLLNLTAKLDATEAFYSFSNGDEFKLGGDGDCPCPDGG
ncbi:MAG: hypothetical protein HKO93_02070, partial [Flavobacteriales bacterium]|nr:hypothetical protein [Flavobacteriales bacterium]